jgi:hypothetical protein
LSNVIRTRSLSVSSVFERKSSRNGTREKLIAEALKKGYRIQLKSAPGFDLYKEHLGVAENYDAVNDFDDYNAELDDHYQSTSLPGVVSAIPPEIPIVPVIASTNPIFPKFIRILEIQDKKMINLIMKNVELRLPYAGVFTRHDDSIESSIIDDPNEIYNTGTLIHIQEAMPVGDHLRLLVQGVRRISFDGENLERNERARDEGTTSVLYGNVSNIPEIYDTNNNTKALCAEIIQSCRDLIQINQLYRESVHQILSQGVRVVDDGSFLSDFYRLF